MKAKITFLLVFSLSMFSCINKGGFDLLTDDDFHGTWNGSMQKDDSTVIYAKAVTDKTNHDISLTSGSTILEVSIMNPPPGHSVPVKCLVGKYQIVGESVKFTINYFSPNEDCSLLVKYNTPTILKFQYRYDGFYRELYFLPGALLVKE